MTDTRKNKRQVSGTFPKKQSPGQRSSDLLAWFLFDKLDQTPSYEIWPGTFEQWLQEFEAADPKELIQYFRSQYEEFPQTVTTHTKEQP